MALLLVVGGDELVDEPLGVDPAQRVDADAELAGVVGDDDGLAEQALGLDRAPQRRFAGHAHRVGRDPQIGEAERAQVAHPFLARAKDPRRMAGEPVDDRLGQIAGAHVGDRGRIDDVAGRPAQQAAQESQARLPRPGAERGEAVGADVGGEAGLAGVARAGVVDGDERRAAKPCRQHLLVLGAERLEFGGQQPHHLTFRDHHPRPASSARIRSQVICP